MMRVSPNEGQHSAPIVMYDAEEDLSHKCCICFLETPTLINPCRCSILYHQICLLQYIKEKLLAMRNELDMSQLKCRVCKQQIKFHYIENTHWGCIKPLRSWCDKTMVCMVMLIIAIIVLSVVLGSLAHKSKAVYLALLVTISFLCLMLLITAAYLFQKNLTYKEIILVRVYEYAERLQNNTSSSSDSPHYQIYSDTF